MKRIATFVAVCTLVCMVSLFVLKSNKVSASPAPKPPAGCFTNNPANYPKAAPANAPIVALKLNVGAEDLYSELQSLTSSQRKAFFKSLNKSQQAEVWIVHLQNYAATHNLNSKQREFIFREIRTLSSGGLNDSAANYKAKFAELKDKAVGLFGRIEAWELFGHLGGKSTLEDNQQVTRFSLNGVVLANPPICQCTDGSDWCFEKDDTRPMCLSSPNICIQIENGCGWYFQDICTGWCF